MPKWTFYRWDLDGCSCKQLFPTWKMETLKIGKFAKLVAWLSQDIFWVFLKFLGNITIAVSPKWKPLKAKAYETFVISKRAAFIKVSWCLEFQGKTTSWDMIGFEMCIHKINCSFRLLRNFTKIFSILRMFYWYKWSSFLKGENTLL